MLDVLLDVSFDAQLGSPATQTSFCHYGNPWRTGGNAIISNTALPPNTLAPTTSRDRTRSQSISLLATSFEFGTCVHPHFSCDEDVTLPPAVAHGFVNAMRDFFAEKNPTKRDAIAAHQLSVLRDHQGPREEKLWL